MKYLTMAALLFTSVQPLFSEQLSQSTVCACKNCKCTVNNNCGCAKGKECNCIEENGTGCSIRI